MIAWVLVAAIGGAAMLALIALRLPRLAWSMAGAALMLGGAGYALTGRPNVPAAPVRVPAPPKADDDAGLHALRDRMFGRFTLDGAYLIAGDAMLRSGDPAAAVRVIRGGIQTLPRSAMLWTGLGGALAVHDGGQVSPPALFAFRQAMRLAPEHPGPPFFLGVAYVRGGDFARARGAWRLALALAPERASYRLDIALRLGLLDQYLGAMGQR